MLMRSFASAPSPSRLSSERSNESLSASMRLLRAARSSDAVDSSVSPNVSARAPSTIVAPPS